MTQKTSSVTPIFYYRIVVSIIIWNFLQSLKKILWIVLRATLKFLESKGGSEPTPQDFYHFTKSYRLSCLSQFDTKTWLPSSYFSWVKSGFLYFAAHIVAMVTCYMKRMTAPCLSTIGHLYTITVASFVKQWQYSSFKLSLLEKC